MSSTLTLNLFVDENQSNYFWMDVVLPSGNGCRALTHEEVPQVNSSDEIHIDVNVDTPDQGSQTFQITIGESSIDTEEGEIHIHLKEGSTTVESEKVLVKNAQESTRPIGIGDLA